MDIEKERRRLRLALSYREKASRLLEQAAARDAGRPGEGEDPPGLTQFYEQHVAAAAHDVARIVAALNAENDVLEAAIEGVRKDLVAIAPSGAPGGVVARRARQRNRTLTAELDRLLLNHEALAKLRAALTAGDAGGYIDQPLDYYAAAVHASPGFASRHLRPARGTVLGVALATAIMAGGVLALFWPRPVLPSQDALAVEAAFPRDAPGVLHVVLTNNGSAARSFYLPWPEGVPDSAAADFGIQIYAGQSAEDDYHLVPSADGVWSHEAAPMQSPSRLVLAPAMGFGLELNLAQLKQQLGALDRMRLLVTRGDGSVVAQFEFEVSSW